MHLSDHALKRPVAVWVFTAACMLLGAVSLGKLKLDFLPQMDFPFIGVYCPYPNAVPEQIERPIEEEE